MISIIYVILIIAASLAGWKQRSLTISGALAAMFVGSAVVAGFSWKGLLILGVFFVSSSFWSKFQQTLKKPIDEKLMKGSQRDWHQVIANGGVAAVISIIHLFIPGEETAILFLVSIAAANADTWASELGVLSRSQPVSFLHFKRVDRGTSGAVSLFGTLCAFFGAFFIACTSVFIFEIYTISFILLVTGFGFLGSMYDTVIGAYLQPEYECIVCGLQTERIIHCSQKTKIIKGFGLLNNDAVNAVSIVLSVFTCYLFL